MHPSNFTPHLVSLVSSIVMGSYHDSPSIALCIFTFFSRSQLSVPFIAVLRTSFHSSLSFAAELTKWSSIFFLRTVLPKTRGTVSLIHCDLVSSHAPSQRVCLFSVTGFIMNTNVLFSLVLPCHSCS